MCLMEARAESSDVCGQGVVRRGKEEDLYCRYLGIITIRELLTVTF